MGEHMCCFGMFEDPHLIQIYKYALTLFLCENPNYLVDGDHDL